MQFKDIVGQRDTINRLTSIIDSGRVSHAQMLLGEASVAMPLAWAYLQYLCCEHRQHFDTPQDGLQADSCGECPSCKKIASLVHPDRLCFAVVGDLAFFYDLNVLGNRHMGKNVRIMLINNGRGTEFHNSDHPASKFGADGDKFMAAAGHFGNKSPELVKHYAQDLGFEYMSASNKEEYLAVCDDFFSPAPKDRPVVFEVFTDSDDESDAIYMLRTALTDGTGSIKQLARDVLGSKLTSKIGRIIGK